MRCTSTSLARHPHPGSRRSGDKIRPTKLANRSTGLGIVNRQRAGTFHRRMTGKRRRQETGFRSTNLDALRLIDMKVQVFRKSTGLLPGQPINSLSHHGWGAGQKDRDAQDLPHIHDMSAPAIRHPRTAWSSPAKELMTKRPQSGCRCRPPSLERVNRIAPEVLLFQPSASDCKALKQQNPAATSAYRDRTHPGPSQSQSRPERSKMRSPQKAGGDTQRMPPPFNSQSSTSQGRRQVMSKRSAFMTLFQVATKSFTNFGCEPAQA